MIDQEPADPKRPDRPPVSPTDSGKATPTNAEEQMAAYEEALKEEDWGHQPC
jgi:hypothetical protein